MAVEPQLKSAACGFLAGDTRPRHPDCRPVAAALFVKARLTIACCEPLAEDFWLRVQGCKLSAVDSCLRIEGLLGESWKALVLTFSFLVAAGPNSKTFYGPGDRNLYKNKGTHRNVSAYI